MVIIDSSVLIAAERGQLNLAEMLRTTQKAAEPAALAAITASELLHGIHRGTTSKQRGKREVFVERLLEALPVLPFDLTTARLHARLWAQLAARGSNVGAHDLLIAATALAHGAAVATREERSFPRIPGITILRW